MKKLIFLIVLSFSINSFSQTSTEKWNSLYERYEYFDSNGTMVGYKKYNSLYERWEYYDLKANNSQPSLGNLDLARKVLSEKQAAYDYNLAKIKTYVVECRKALDSSNMNATLVQNIKDSFNANYLMPYYNKGYDLSSDETTNKIIEWLQAGLLSTIKFESEKFNAQQTKPKGDEVLDFMNYHGGYHVPLINEYILEKGVYKLVKKETSGNYFYYDGDTIHFKRGENSEWLFQKITFKIFNSIMNTYSYTSDYGDVFIDKNFKIITFIQEDETTVRKYEYVIGDYDKNIKLD